MNDFTTHFLEMLLRVFRIDVSSWGKGEARTVADLHTEIMQGECCLKIEGDRPNVTITRVVEIVKMLIRHPDYLEYGHLLEKAQILPDGRYRQRMQNPSGKFKKGESPEQCLKRELFSELRLSEGDYKFHLQPTHIEPRTSKSYPGLECVYVIHPFDVLPLRESSILKELTFNIAEEEDGVIHLFGWENPP